MSDTNYLIYLDILGFEDLPQEIASKTRVKPSKVREDFLDVINERVEVADAKGEIEGKRYGDGDDWLLVADSFKSVFRILNHDTGYLDFPRIPLEIAVGTIVLGRGAELEGVKLSIEDDAIAFLKTHIVDYYRKYYREQHDDQPIKSTFIVLTESAHRELEPIDKTKCRLIEYQGVKFFAADLEAFLKRGKVFNFLDQIEHPSSRLYYRIDELYVPPLEYEKIRSTLAGKQFVFITGTQEYGKTYTAVRLMWEYYRRGYQPRWVKGKEKNERIRIREKLENMRAELKPGHVIYFEDPFGKTEYERRESLEREIAALIDCIRQVDDAYVLMTSREEVFKEFQKETVTAGELEAFEHKLNIKKPSYDFERRKAMVLKWGEGEGCKWLKNDKLRQLIIESMRNENVLPTPLSIRDFALATINIVTEDELREKIKEKSEETEKAFAKEIKNMTDDKIAFLLFPFVGFFPVDFVRTTYRELVKQLGMKNAWEFDCVLNWFRDDKVKISWGDRIGFSHPSYSKALGYLLTENGYISRINAEILSKLLLKLAENSYSAANVASVVADRFDELSENVRNQLLLKLAEKGEERGLDVVSTIVKNFDRLPDQVRHLLFELAEGYFDRGYVISAVARNFDRLPENVRGLLFKLAEEDNNAFDVAYVIVDEFDELSEKARNQLLPKALEKDNGAWGAALALANNWLRLPENTRNQLMLKLAERDNRGWALPERLDRFPMIADELTRVLKGLL